MSIYIYIYICGAASSMSGTQMASPAARGERDALLMPSIIIITIIIMIITVMMIVRIIMIITMTTTIIVIMIMIVINTSNSNSDSNSDSDSNSNSKLPNMLRSGGKGLWSSGKLRLRSDQLVQWWEDRFYTPPPPGSNFKDCKPIGIETKASYTPPPLGGGGGV